MYLRQGNGLAWSRPCTQGNRATDSTGTGSTCCSCRGTTADSQGPHSHSQSPCNSTPRDPMLSFGRHGTRHACDARSHTQAKHPYMQIIILKGIFPTAPLPPPAGGTPLPPGHPRQRKEPTVVLGGMAWSDSLTVQPRLSSSSPSPCSCLPGAPISSLSPAGNGVWVLLSHSLGYFPTGKLGSGSLGKCPLNTPFTSISYSTTSGGKGQDVQLVILMACPRWHKTKPIHPTTWRKH